MQHATSLPLPPPRRASALVDGSQSSPATPVERARAPPGAGSASVPARRTRGAGSWTPFTPNLPPVDEPQDGNGALGGRCMSADNLQLLNAPTLPVEVSEASVFDMRVDAGGSSSAVDLGPRKPLLPTLPSQRRSAGGVGTVSGPALAAAMQAMMVAMFVVWMYLAAVSQEFVNLVPVVT